VTLVGSAVLFDIVGATGYDNVTVNTPGLSDSVFSVRADLGAANDSFVINSGVALAADGVVEVDANLGLGPTSSPSTRRAPRWAGGPIWPSKEGQASTP